MDMSRSTRYFFFWHDDEIFEYFMPVLYPVFLGYDCFSYAYGFFTFSTAIGSKGVQFVFQKPGMLLLQVGTLTLLLHVPCFFKFGKDEG